MDRRRARREHIAAGPDRDFPNAHGVALGQLDPWRSWPIWASATVRTFAAASSMAARSPASVPLKRPDRLRLVDPREPGGRSVASKRSVSRISAWSPPSRTSRSIE